MVIKVTYTKPRHDVIGVDAVQIDGETARQFVVNFRNVMGFEPQVQTEYSEIGLRIDSIET